MIDTTIPYGLETWWNPEEGRRPGQYCECGARLLELHKDGCCNVQCAECGDPAIICDCGFLPLAAGRVWEAVAFATAWAKSAEAEKKIPSD